MDWSPLVGIPFVDRGRDATGCDCWGLVRLALRAGAGLDLPSLADGYAGRADWEHIRSLVEESRPDWIEVLPGAERPLDLILMAIAGHQHVGVVVRKGSMLHMPRDSFSAIEPYTTSRYRAAVARGGFYRHRILA